VSRDVRALVAGVEPVDLNRAPARGVDLAPELAALEHGAPAADRRAVFFDLLSPGAPNGRGSLQVSGAPRVSRPAGAFAESIAIELSAARLGEIRYTIDGSRPRWLAPHARIAAETSSPMRGIVRAVRSEAESASGSPSNRTARKSVNVSHLEAGTEFTTEARS
jgi:hypothetical protein